MVVKTKTKIGPQHQGHKMSLRAFEFAEVKDGYLYELARGYVIVSEVANYFHGSQVDVIQSYLQVFRVNHPGIVYRIFDGISCKMVIREWDSERHPDLAIYLTPPQGRKDSTMWRTWIPEVIIEVVSASSVERDYVEKREEYWTLGAKEYWIVDAAMGKITQLRRGKSDWLAKELFADDVVETKLLPGFKLPCQPIFDAAAEHDDDY
jgi:Uma2 family endonuclease